MRFSTKALPAAAVRAVSPSIARLSGTQAPTQARGLPPGPDARVKITGRYADPPPEAQPANWLPASKGKETSLELQKNRQKSSD
jgi:hypothetical protein